MTLTDAQRDQVRQWLGEGLKLSDVQRRLESAFGLRVTYMEVRFLVDDLKVVPKDPEPPKKPEATPAEAQTPEAAPLPEEPVQGALGPVKVTVDTVTRPNAMVSGRVTFSDGERAVWLIDQTGRPGLLPDRKGYRPSTVDLQDFQMLLEQELSKYGM